MSIICNFKAPQSEYSLWFEDDGRTGYAYLKRSDAIVGDLWLYNRCIAPDISEWSDRDNAPFANCQGYTLEGSEMKQTVSQKDVIVDWESGQDGPVAYIYIFEDLYGYLWPGAKPGFARLAAKDGPVARRMELENEASRAIK